MLAAFRMRNGGILDFASAGKHFQAVLPSAEHDARLQQNLAIVRGWQSRGDRAVEYWRHFLAVHKEQIPAPDGMRDYHARIEQRVTQLIDRLLRESVSK